VAICDPQGLESPGSQDPSTVNAFKDVVHEKMIFKGFCCINLCTIIPP